MEASLPRVIPDFCSRRHPFHLSTALATLMRLGVDVHRIELLAIGKHANYKGEIHGQEPKAGTPITADTRVVLTVGAYSAVDLMPYQFFYGLGGARDSTGAWEESGRRLLAPFDATVLRHMAITDYEAMKSRGGFFDPDHISRLLKLFNFDTGEDTDSPGEAMLWSALLPTFHFWAGNPDFVEKVLEYSLGYKFRIEEHVRARYDIPEDLQYQLGSGDGRLGQQTVLGKSFSECDSCYRVTAVDVAPDDVDRFLPGKAGYRKIEKILRMCMPGHLEYRIAIKTKRSGFVLGRAQKRGCLGYTSFVFGEK